MIVCDSSAIYTAISMGRSARVAGQYTSPLALYELGNVIWKNSVIGKIYTQKEASELLSVCEIVLEKMRLVHPDLNNIYRISADCHVSFYDAAYACLAADLKAPLVTLDNKLTHKIRSVVDILPFDQFISK